MVNLSFVFRQSDLRLIPCVILFFLYILT
uniref:Uncharacterized protein n=1 Tax=Anguilla anguilla TaxID=7936 RepID=A0A0E9SIS0_ANGAN